MPLPAAKDGNVGFAGMGLGQPLGVFVGTCAGWCPCRYYWLEGAGWYMCAGAIMLCFSCWDMDHTCRLVDAASELEERFKSRC